jgi:hypothetical protein
MDYGISVFFFFFLRQLYCPLTYGLEWTCVGNCLGHVHNELDLRCEWITSQRNVFSLVTYSVSELATLHAR